MPTTINQELTVTDLLQLLNEKVTNAENTHNIDTVHSDTQTNSSANMSNKRIGLTKIDPKVYELLDNPCTELFEG